MTSRRALELAKQLPGVTIKDHFGSDAFSANGRTFLTIWHREKKANLRFSKEQQTHFLSLDGDGFSEIDNGWGRQGWTSVNLEFVSPEEFSAALRAAYEYSAVKTPRSAAAKSKVKRKRKATPKRTRTS